MNPYLIPVAAALAGLAFSQQPEPLAAMFPTPIHTAPDDPDFGPYGHWCAGRDFKVSFGQQVVFYPWLGPGHAQHLPLAWRTHSVTAGGVPWRLFEGDAEVAYTERQWRLGRGDVDELWDVRADGIEQSFVLHTRPGGGRDVVIRGSVATPLHAAVRTPQQAPIDFHDDGGAPIVRYGEAVAFDASGDRIAIATSWDGAVIGLHVPGAWLESARLPVTVDPLLTRVNLGSAFNSLGVQSTDTVSALYRTDPHTVCYVYSRLFTDNDIDAYGLMCNSTFTNVVTIWQDLPTFDTLLPHCAYNSPVDSWVIAFERRSTTSSVRAYRHLRSSTTVGSGTLSFLANSSGSSNRRPDVGGVYFQAGLPYVLLVYEREDNSTSSDTTVWAVKLDCTTGAFDPSFLLDFTFPPVEQRSPSIVSFAKGSTFGVAWHRNSPPFEAAVKVARTSFTSVFSSPITVGAGAGYDSVSPRIDGDATDRFMVAFTARNLVTFAPRVDYALFDWSTPLALAPTLVRQATIAAGTLFSPVVLDGVAYDFETRSHHCLVHHQGSTVRATRTGYTGGIVEQASLPTSGNAVAGSVGYLHATVANGQGRYPMFFSDNAAGQPIWASAMTYPTTQVTGTGTGCHGALLHGGAVPQPYAGNGNFGVETDGLLPGAVTLYAAAFGSTSLPIPGAPGCTLQLDPASMLLLSPQIATPSGVARLTVPLPDDPVWIGDLYLQCTWLDSSLNALGLGLSNGLWVPVR